MIAVCLFTAYCFQSAMLTGTSCNEDDDDNDDEKPIDDPIPLEYE